jgi:hypothetical protein
MTANTGSRATLAGLVAAITVAAVTGLGAPAAGAGAVTSGGTWGNAQEVPGTAALNADGRAGVESVSCASAGNCSAGGSYLDSSGTSQAFVVTETGGTWGTAQEVPGTAGPATVRSVSCASAGNCTAGGYYQAGGNQVQAFVVAETGGIWGTAQEVAGIAALNAGGSAATTSVSCASVGNCGGGGWYTDNSGNQQSFVVTERNGVWHKAKEVPGTQALNTRGNGTTSTMSCTSAGNCGADGFYCDNSGCQLFVVTQSNGVWGKAKEVPGTAALNTGGDAYAGAGSLSCASAGNCSTGGYYEDKSFHLHAFVATQSHGVWGKAKQVPGSAALNTGGRAGIDSLSCASARACSAGGFYTDFSGHEHAFVVTESGGIWGKAKEVPGTAALNAGGSAAISAVSCASAGNCSAGGSYRDSSSHDQAFVVTESSGRWGRAKQLPGSAALNAASAGIDVLSCASVGNCGAGGSYQDSSGHTQVFVAGETNP